MILAATMACGALRAQTSAEVYRVENYEGTPLGKVCPVPECGVKATCLLLDGTTLYCGANRALWIFDVSEPLKPRLLGSAKGIGEPRQLAAENGIVYVGARETGVWIIDAVNPAAPKLVNRFDTIELATGMDVCGGVLFVGQRQNGVEFVDVRDALHPAHIRIEKTAESQSVWYRDGWLYSGDWGAGEVTVIDAHDMATVKTVRRVPLKGHGDGISLNGRWLYAATGHHYHDKTKSREENFGAGHGLEIFDLTNPAQPRFVSRVQFPRFYTLGSDWWTPRPSGDGKTVFVADTHNGLFAVDVSQVQSPRVLARMTIAEKTPEVKRPGAVVNHVAVGDGAVYVASAAGLAVIASARAKPLPRARGKAPVNLGFRAKYPTPPTSRFTAWTPRRSGQVRGVATLGDFCYVACGHAGLAILRRDAQGALASVGEIPATFVGDVKIKNGKLYAAEGLDGLAVYSLADPARPKLLRRVTDFGSATPCAIWVWTPNVPYVIVSNRQDGYLFLDEREDLNVVHVSRGNCPGWDRYLADDAIGGGRWLAQSTANTGFKWLDLSGAKPVEAIRCKGYNKGGLNDGCIAFRGDRLLRMMDGGYALLAPGQRPVAEGVNWPHVSFVNRAKVGGQPAWDGGSKLALTSRIRRQVALCDISDETKPKVLWEEEVSGHPDTAIFWNGRLVVPCGYQGLLIQK